MIRYIIPLSVFILTCTLNVFADMVSKSVNGTEFHVIEETISYRGESITAWIKIVPSKTKIEDDKIRFASACEEKEVFSIAAKYGEEAIRNYPIGRFERKFQNLFFYRQFIEVNYHLKRMRIFSYSFYDRFR